MRGGKDDELGRRSGQVRRRGDEGEREREGEEEGRREGGTNEVQLQRPNPPSPDLDRLLVARWRSFDLDTVPPALPLYAHQARKKERKERRRRK